VEEINLESQSLKFDFMERKVVYPICDPGSPSLALRRGDDAIVKIRIKSATQASLRAKWHKEEREPHTLANLTVRVETSQRGGDSRTSVSATGRGNGKARVQVQQQRAHKALPAMGKVYKIVSPSGKGYVGQTRVKLSTRMAKNKAVDKNSNMLVGGPSCRFGFKGNSANSRAWHASPEWVQHFAWG
jgi:hypothetical protein